MPNALANETSPYLLQHAENPVAWYPWGEAALDKAKKEDRPIFLSIGYAACHWCHVMAHESFEDPETAALLNQNFVSIKVDREERPDLDALYMGAVVAMTGQGGWPMSLFLTPDGQPFFGGTYFPPNPRYGMPSFRQVLESVIHSWEEERGNLLQVGLQVTEHLQHTMEWDTQVVTLQDSALEQAASQLVSSYDQKDGGWGKAPKFPQPMVIEFLLARSTRGDQKALDIAVHALNAMSQGGMYDLIGGGFHRYSTDAIWLVPHFEKMLYDNAQLARVYLHAYQVTNDVHFRQICEHTLDFIIRELTSPEGGFYSSLDADSEGIEGKYYTWTPEEIYDALGGEHPSELVTAAYGITAAGNFEGKNIIRQNLDNETIASRFKLSKDQVEDKLAHYRHKLLKRRDQRIQPGIDDKVIVSWNAFAQTAFAEAGIVLKREDYIKTATRNARLILEKMHPDHRLMRAYRAGRANHNGYLEDYAAFILSLLAIYQADPDPFWFSTACSLMDEMRAHYSDPAVGFFDTRDDQEQLLARPKEMQDNATPSGNALAALALLKLSAYTGEGAFRDQAEKMLSSVQDLAMRYPTAFGFWLTAIDFAIGPVKQIALIGEHKDPRLKALADIIYSVYRPRSVVAESALSIPSGSPDLLQDRPMTHNLPTAYVCEEFVCRLPVNDPTALKDQLDLPD